MAAVTVSAELKLRDGKREKTCVQVQNNMTSLIHGVHELNASVSRLLTELVQREKAQGAEEREDSDEDGDEDEETEGPLNPEIQPPAKRPRS